MLDAKTKGAVAVVYIRVCLRIRRVYIRVSSRMLAYLSNIYPRNSSQGVITVVYRIQPYYTSHNTGFINTTPGSPNR